MSVDPALDPERFDFELPPDRIAQHPAPEREAARLLVMARDAAGDLGPGAPRLEHRSVRELPELLRAGDLLVVNATRVVAARLQGRKRSGGRVEALVLGPVADRPRHYRALVRTNGRLKCGLELVFEAPGIEREAELVERTEDGEAVLAFASDASPYEIGEAPLPPYIRRDSTGPRDAAFDTERYQTVYSRVSGAVAAPTAGLHLTWPLLDAVKAAGVEVAEVVLHVGIGTFRPLRDEDLAARRLHAEHCEVPPATADAIGRARARGGRVIAVGTTTTRALESRVDADGHVSAGAGETDLFLYPGCSFRVVDGLLTNFHLPRSSLLYLVAAFAGRERVLAGYAEAIAARYRFYSYGDAMLIL